MKIVPRYDGDGEATVPAEDDKAILTRGRRMPGQDIHDPDGPWPRARGRDEDNVIWHLRFAS